MEKGRSKESVVKGRTLAQILILKNIAKRKVSKPIYNDYFDYLDYGDSKGDFC